MPRKRLYLKVGPNTYCPFFGNDEVYTSAVRTEVDVSETAPTGENDTIAKRGLVDFPVVRLSVSAEKEGQGGVIEERKTATINCSVAKVSGAVTSLIGKTIYGDLKVVTVSIPGSRYKG